MASADVDNQNDYARLLEQARQHIKHVCGNLPKDVSSIVTQLWSDLETRIEHFSRDPVLCKLITALSSSAETSAVLFTALAHVNERLCSAEATTVQLRAQLTVAQELCSAKVEEVTNLEQSVAEFHVMLAELQAQLGEHKSQVENYKKQTADLMLRQASYMVVNKLARMFLVPKDGKKLTPKQAARYNLDNVIKSNATDKVGLQAYLSKRPGLDLGLQLLAGQYTTVAHPHQLPLGFDGLGTTVTIEYLKTCLEEECLASTFVDADAVQQVLVALDDLSRDLGEPLFVATK